MATFRELKAILDKMEKEHPDRLDMNIEVITDDDWDTKQRPNGIVVGDGVGIYSRWDKNICDYDRII